MHDARSFILFWLANSGLLYFAPFVFSDLAMTGNARLAPFMAAVISGFLLTCANALTMPAADFLKVKIKVEWHWMVIFLGVNIITIWLLARYADLTGVGIANIWVAVVLGAVANALQWLIWKYVTKAKK